MWSNTTFASFASAGNIWRFAAEAKVGGTVVAEAVVSAMLGETQASV